VVTVDLHTGTSVAANLERVTERIARAAERSGRTPSDVTLVAVTKTVPPERIIQAIAAGVTHLGENRVQEAEVKFGPSGRIPRSDVTLHMIGTLQRNKARRAAALFDWVQSLDRPELAAALDSAAVKPLPVLLEVNLTGEPSKSGISPGHFPLLADIVAGCPNLQPFGLMTIARLGAPEAELRRTFATLRDLLERLRAGYPGDWRHLSMGMTGDYEIAIEEGATLVRLGRAIFGERPAASR
jgi:pyridoxal phosphate enzyme (YggS family)